MASGHPKTMENKLPSPLPLPAWERVRVRAARRLLPPISEGGHSGLRQRMNWVVSIENLIAIHPRGKDSQILYPRCARCPLWCLFLSIGVRMSRRHRVSPAWWFLAPALAAIAVFFFLPVAASVLLSLTDFDIYAIASRANLRVVGIANYARLLARSAVLDCAAQHGVLRRRRRAAVGRRLAGGRAVAVRQAGALQGHVSDDLLPAGRDHAGGRRGGVALRLPSAFRPAEPRPGAAGTRPRSTGWAIRAGRCRRSC